LQRHWGKHGRCRTVARDSSYPNASDTKIEIKLSKQADNTTKVEIRVATFGDEPMSRAILDCIKANL
jgi:hypothetical protein